MTNHLRIAFQPVKEKDTNYQVRNCSASAAMIPIYIIRVWLALDLPTPTCDWNVEA